MFEKTNGVVLHTIAYNESSSIVHILTERFGRVAYVLPNSRSKRSQVKRNLFQPLSLLELEVEHKGARQIQRIKEARVLIPLNFLHVNPIKSAIALLLTEVIERFVPEHDAPDQLYPFVSSAVQLLDLSQQGVANFHLLFLYRLTRILGFAPQCEEWQRGYWFEWSHGSFKPQQPVDSPSFSPAESELIYQIAAYDFSNMEQLVLNREERNQTMENLLTYLRYHTHSEAPLRSPEVLKQLFT